MPRMLAGALLLAASVLVTAMPVLAQQPAWPQRNVRLVLPFGPGSGADFSARLLGEHLQRKWGHSLVVENRPGGDGIIAVQAMVQANDDHVLFYGGTAAFTVHPYQREKLPYNRARDLLPIARISNTLLGIGVPASSDMRSLKDVVERAKREPGKLNAAAVPGIMELYLDGWMKEQDIRMVKVPYRDIVQSVPDVSENRIQFLTASIAMMRPGVDGKTVRLVAVHAKERLAIAPDVPTAREAGHPLLEYDGLVGVLGPKIMSLELRRRVGADFIEPLKDPDVRARIENTLQAVNPGGPEELLRSMDQQDEDIARIAAMIGLQKKAQD
jgi:tripartite-type tricarboxylate transporter receptor subunit TctC